MGDLVIKEKNWEVIKTIGGIVIIILVLSILFWGMIYTTSTRNDLTGASYIEKPTNEPSEDIMADIVDRFPIDKYNTKLISKNAVKYSGNLYLVTMIISINYTNYYCLFEYIRGETKSRYEGLIVKEL